MSSTIEALSTGWRERGFFVTEIPNEIYLLLKYEVLQRINNCRSEEEVTAYINGLDEPTFRSLFSKWNRFYSYSTAICIEAYISRFASALGAKTLSISPISINERRKNLALVKGDRDFFFRCVRSHRDDVAPAHFDAMFWEILKNTDADPEVSRSYSARWKVWIPLIGCDQSNSLQVVAGSQAEDIPVQFSMSGRASYAIGSEAKVPQVGAEWLRENESRFYCPPDLRPGKLILFHDRLVHRGPTNYSKEKTPRISCEFTILAD